MSFERILGLIDLVASLFGALEHILLARSHLITSLTWLIIRTLKFGCHTLLLCLRQLARSIRKLLVIRLSWSKKLLYVEALLTTDFVMVHEITVVSDIFVLLN